MAKYLKIKVFLHLKDNSRPKISGSSFAGHPEDAQQAAAGVLEGAARLFDRLSTLASTQCHSKSIDSVHKDVWSTSFLNWMIIIN